MLVNTYPSLDGKNCYSINSDVTLPIHMHKKQMFAQLLLQITNPFASVEACAWHKPRQSGGWLDLLSRPGRNTQW